MFAALIAQILLASRGIELAGVWRDLFSARGLQLRSAGAWWLMAASAFVIGAAVAGRLEPPAAAVGAVSLLALARRRGRSCSRSPMWDIPPRSMPAQALPCM